jgi:hypothetical protein
MQVHPRAIGLSELGEYGRQIGRDHDVEGAALLRLVKALLAAQPHRLSVGLGSLVLAIAQPVVRIAEIEPG